MLDLAMLYIFCKPHEMPNCKGIVYDNMSQNVLYNKLDRQLGSVGQE